MLVSLAILAVVAGTSAVHLGTGAGKLQILNQAKILGAEISALKVLASESGCDYELRPVPPEVFSHCNRKTRALSFPKNIAVTANQPLVFYRTGVVSPGTIRMREGRAECTITASLRGRVTVSCR